MWRGAISIYNLFFLSPCFLSLFVSILRRFLSHTFTTPLFLWFSRYILNAYFKSLATSTTYVSSYEFGFDALEKKMQWNLIHMNTEQAVCAFHFAIVIKSTAPHNFPSIYFNGCRTVLFAIVRAKSIVLEKQRISTITLRIGLVSVVELTIIDTLTACSEFVPHENHDTFMIYTNETGMHINTYHCSCRPTSHAFEEVAKILDNTNSGSRGNNTTTATTAHNNNNKVKPNWQMFIQFTDSPVWLLCPGPFQKMLSLWLAVFDNLLFGIVLVGHAPLNQIGISWMLQKVPWSIFFLLIVWFISLLIWICCFLTQFKLFFLLNAKNVIFLEVLEKVDWIRWYILDKLCVREKINRPIDGIQSCW